MSNESPHMSCLFLRMSHESWDMSNDTLRIQRTATHCNTLQHTATHCNSLQHTATHCNTLRYTATHCNTLQHTATHYNSLRHTAAHCNTLQHTATHCSTLQHTATVRAKSPKEQTRKYLVRSAAIMCYCKTPQIAGDTTHSCLTWRIHTWYDLFICDMTH